MPKATGPSNPVMKNLIADLRDMGHNEKSKFLLNLSELLEKPERRRATVNLSKIQRFSKENETVLVPGKVLSTGIITKPVNVACFSLSREAWAKIKKAGGRAINIRELVKENPKGKGVKIIC